MDLEAWMTWSGDASKLASDADRLLADHVARQDDVQITVRLIRDYQGRGILLPPERRGQRAIYGSRQLMQLVAARILVSDGWPLAKIAETIGSTSPTGLSAIIGGHADREAQGTGRNLRAAGTDKARSASPPLAGDFAAMASTIGRLRADLRNRRRRLDLPSEAGQPTGFIEFTISAECRVEIDSRLLDALTLERAVDLGQVIAATLVVHIADRSAASAAKTQRK